MSNRQASELEAAYSTLVAKQVVISSVITFSRQALINTPIQEKAGSCMEARPKGPSAFATPGGKNRWVVKKVSRSSK